MPWQERGLSQDEIDFRRQAEERKTRLLAGRGPLQRPVMLDAGARDRALRNIKSAAWARDLVQAARETADYLVAQPATYAASMISELTPWYEYGMTCPNCVGVKSQEGVGHGLLHWDFRDPDKLTCAFCGHVYPSAKYPETQNLVCPRTGQTFTFYLNPKEQADPENRTGELAYHWVGHPMHMSFSGTIRWYKANFMIKGACDLALTGFLTGDVRYSRRAQEILVRLAACYRNWLYHDYWNTVADAEPLYAAAHDMDLELVWKRHLATAVFEGDSLTRPPMKQTFWGGGRLHPSTDSMGTLYDVSLAFDLVPAARDAAGRELWSAADRETVERDLLLEWIFTGEPYVGGPDQAKLINNKTPRIYHAFASVARALGLPAPGRHRPPRLRGRPGRVVHRRRLQRREPRLHDDVPERAPADPRAPQRLRLAGGLPGAARRGRPLRERRQAQADVPHDARPAPGRRRRSCRSRTRKSADRAPGECIEMGLKRYPEYFAGKTGTLLGQEQAGKVRAVQPRGRKRSSRPATSTCPRSIFPAG